MAIIGAVTLFDIVFVVISVITLLCALAMILSNNIVHSAIAMVFCFLGIAGLYFTMEAGFLAMVQVMVYAGAISVIFIFAFMILMNRDPSESNLSSPKKGNVFIGGLLAFATAVGLVIAVVKTSFPVTSTPAGDVDHVGAIAELMLGNYVIPFEAAALLLLVAVIGAILLARGVEKDK